MSDITVRYIYSWPHVAIYVLAMAVMLVALVILCLILWDMTHDFKARK